MRRLLLRAATSVAVFVSFSCDSVHQPSRPTSQADLQGAIPGIALPVSTPLTVEWRCLVSTPFPPADCPPRRSALRVTAAAAFGPAAPANPQVLTVNITGVRVVLTWSPPIAGDSPTSYVLEAGSAPGLSDLVNTDTGSVATIFTADNVPAGTYFVRVRARNSGGTSGASNEVQVVVGGAVCTAAPGVPALSVSVFSRTFTLTWSAASGTPTSYVIEGGSGPGQTNLANFDTGNTLTSYTAQVDPGSYYIRVRARNACGRSNASNEVNVFLPPYTVAFRPLLRGPDPCGVPAPGGLCAQAIVPRGDLGAFHEFWSPGTPVIEVDGNITETTFTATMRCTNGSASGSISATWNGSRYLGTWTFGNRSGTARIDRGIVDPMCEVP